MFRLVVMTVVALVMVAACTGGDGDSFVVSTDISAVESPEQVVTEQELLTMLPALSDFPEGWVRAADNAQPRPTLCDAIEERENLVDLEVPRAEVDYESRDGDVRVIASIAVMPSSTAAISRIDSLLAIVADPSCKRMRVEGEVAFEVTVREISSSDSSTVGFGMIVALAEDVDDATNGTVIFQSVLMSRAVGRCGVAVSFGHQFLGAEVPDSIEVEERLSHIIEQASEYGPCFVDR